ncbi:MAG: ThuA domain-containing protein [Planctomycetota bacterium]
MHQSTLTVFTAFVLSLITSLSNAQGLVFEAKKGIGKDKHIVLIAGDEEYRSEESCPMLAKILNTHHGFKTTVLFSVDPVDGFVDPNQQKNIPGMDAVKTADVVIIGTRFRDLPEEHFQPLADYLNAGKPIIGFRTATHAFRTGKKTGGIRWGSFGPDVLGEGWAGHYGRHKKEGARGIIVEAHKDHPILRSVKDVFADSDVYGVRRVTDKNATILIKGQVTDSLLPNSKPVKGKQLQPSSWIKKYKTPNGKEGKAFCSTMGSSSDFRSEDLRRLFINATIYFAGLEVPAKANVELVDKFTPSFYGFIRKKGYFKNLGHKPKDYGYGNSPLSGPFAKHY